MEFNLTGREMNMIDVYKKQGSQYTSLGRIFNYSLKPWLA